MSLWLLLLLCWAKERGGTLTVWSEREGEGEREGTAADAPRRAAIQRSHGHCSSPSALSSPSPCNMARLTLTLSLSLVMTATFLSAVATASSASNNNNNKNNNKRANAAPTPPPTNINECTTFGNNRAYCLAMPGCRFFPQDIKQYPRSVPDYKRQTIGCQREFVCTPFWNAQDCASQAEWCTWTGTACVTTDLLPSGSPTVTPPPTSACESSPASASQAACAAVTSAQCEWIEMRVCNKKKTSCSSVSYGCKPLHAFCDFTQGPFPQTQCAAFAPYCVWDESAQSCGLAGQPTKSPTPAPTSTCPVNTTPDTCKQAREGCDWYELQDCDRNGKRCKTVSYGCQAATGFCAMTAGTYPKYQCAQLASRSCAWSDAANACVYAPLTTSPSRAPTKALPPTRLPTRKPSTKPTVKPTQSPTNFPTAQPSPRPSRDPTTSRPSRSPQRKPTKKPTPLPSNAPTPGPTFAPTDAPTGVACSSLATQAECATTPGVANRCEWVVVRACTGAGGKPPCQTYTYGCQDKPFCDMSQGTTPRARQAQCQARSALCLWNPTTSTCESKCAGLKRTCGASTLSSTSAAKMVRFEGSDVLDHAGSAFARGDIDGDGRDDLVMGVRDAGPKIMPNRPGTGRVVIALGGGNALPGGANARAQWPLPTDTSQDLSRGLVVLNGTQLEAQFGTSVAVVDWDRDGFADVVLGAPFAANPITGDIMAGMVCIVWGRPDFAAAAAAGLFNDLTAADPSVAVCIPGPTTGESMGSDVASAGDFDRDGRVDLLVGSRNFGARAGAAYIIYGSGKRFATNPFDLASAPARTFSRVQGASDFSFLGTAVDGGGNDLDGDGFADVVLGNPWETVQDVAGVGLAWIVFGRAGRALTLDLGTENAAGRALRVEGMITNWGNLGAQVAMVGDVNGDGVKDVAVSAIRADGIRAKGSGEVYVLFGSSALRSVPGGTLSVAQLDGTIGFKVTGSRVNDQLGFGLVRGDFDFNGDGFADVGMGAPNSTPPSGLSLAGGVYVVFGKCSSFAAQVDVQALNGVAGMVLQSARRGETAGAALGFVRVSSAATGAVRSALVVGAPYSSREAGAVYVVGVPC